MKKVSIFKTVKNHPEVTLCAVTKQRSLQEVQKLLQEHPQIKDIAENRWPDCEEKFKYFAKHNPEIKKHFIGPLQSNKVKKVVELVDIIQSVDSEKLLEKIDAAALKNNKKIQFCFQVNISKDKAKHGIEAGELEQIIIKYKEKNYKNLELIGLMTIGAKTDMNSRSEYFKKLKTLFDKINQKHFTNKKLKTLSMGMTEDYELAIKSGSTMIRVGRGLFESPE